MMITALKRNPVGAQPLVKDHLVLRCRGKDTINLAKRLMRLGADTWTPVHRRRLRLARQRKVHLVDMPTLASYVFIRHEDFSLAEKARSRYRCPAFWAMRKNGNRISIWDNELDHLRRLSAEMDADNAELLMVGTQAIVTSGPMAEYMVKVIGCEGVYNIVTDLTERWRVRSGDGERISALTKPYIYKVPLYNADGSEMVITTVVDEHGNEIRMKDVRSSTPRRCFRNTQMR